MKVTGSAVLHATPERVWAAITDPVVLADVIPGCDVLNPLGDNHFGMTVTLGVAAIKGSYTGEVRLLDLVPTRSLTLRAAGAGGPGTIDTTVAVVLVDQQDGTTGLTYDADAVVGGMVGGVGQRVLTSVAKKTAGLFFAAVDDVLTGARQVAAQPVATAAATPPGGTLRPVPPAAPAPALQPAALVAATVAGALSMAIGVWLGSRIARPPR